MSRVSPTSPNIKTLSADLVRLLNQIESDTAAAQRCLKKFLRIQRGGHPQTDSITADQLSALSKNRRKKAKTITGQYTAPGRKRRKKVW